MKRIAVRDLMTENVLSLGPKHDLMHLKNLMDEVGVRHVPVVDEEKNLLGLVSHRDLLRQAPVNPEALPRNVHEDMLRRTRVGDVMNDAVLTVGPEQDIREAAQLMYENKYGCLPVVEGRRLVGILTESDFVRYFTRPR